MKEFIHVKFKRKKSNMRLFDSQVPLKAGEKHCPYCNGYGCNPNRHDPYKTHSYAGRWHFEKCGYCQGVGKYQEEEKYLC